MGWFRTTGKIVGNVGGGIIGGSVRLSGKVVGIKFKKTGKYMEEIGGITHQASKNVMDNTGQFLDGSVKGTYGILTKSDYYKNSGWSDVKDSSGRTVKGLGQTLSYTAAGASTTFRGLVRGDKDEVIAGTKNLGKVVAVSTLAIGLIDFADGSDVVDAETRNDHLASDVHPETGVPFVERTVELPSGEEYKGTFPVFESSFSISIAEELYLDGYDAHFDVANETLYQSIQNNPGLANEMGLSPSDVQELASGQTPDGFTWHHHEEPGVLQLVDQDVHANTGHTGGGYLWAGGKDY